jgi:hypothetical protein
MAYSNDDPTLTTNDFNLEKVVCMHRKGELRIKSGSKRRPHILAIGWWWGTSQYVKNRWAKLIHQLREKDQGSKTGRMGERHSLTVEHRGRDNSGHQENAGRRGALTLC